MELNKWKETWMLRSFFATLVAASFALIFMYFGRGKGHEGLRTISVNQGPANLAGRVFGEDITVAQIVGNEQIEHYFLEKQLFDWKLGRLKDYAVQKIISAAALKEKMSSEEFIQKKILKDKMTISESEMNEFLKEKNISKEQQSDPRIRERLKAFLLVQKRDKLIRKFLADSTRKVPVEIFLHRPVFGIEVDTAQALKSGPNDAPVSIVEFTDMECNDCRSARKMLDLLKEKYGKRIQFNHRYFPGSGDPELQAAALGAYCANEQGHDLYERYLKNFIEVKARPVKADILAFGKKINLNSMAFKSCLESGRFSSLMIKDVQYGQQIGIHTAPVLFLNNEPIALPLNLNQLKERIDEIIESK